MLDRIKSAAKKTAKAGWVVLDGPRTFFGLKTTKTYDLAKEEALKRGVEIGRRKEFWKEEIQRTLPKPGKNSTAETFEMAMERYGLVDADLENIVHVLEKKSKVEVVILYIGLIGLVVSIPFASIFGLISGVVMFLYFFLVHARTRHRLVQTKSKSLSTFRSFIRKESIIGLMKYD